MIAGHYAYELDGGWAVSFGARAGLGSRSSDGQEATVRWLGLEALFERRERLGGLQLRAGVGPTAESVFQRMRDEEVVRLEHAGYQGQRDSRGVLVGAMGTLGARVFPVDAVYLGLEATLRILSGTLQEQHAVFLGAGAGASAGFVF